MEALIKKIPIKVAMNKTAYKEGSMRVILRADFCANENNDTIWRVIYNIYFPPGATPIT